MMIGGLAYAAWVYFNDRGRLTTTATYTGLAGKFSNGVFQSPANPRANITISPDYKYVGGQKFILYGSADVEQHFFIKAHQDGLIESAFLLQFESVKSGVDWQYDYSDAQSRTQIGPFKFYTDVAPLSLHPIFSHGKPGTDFNLESKYLSSKGYHYPKDYVWARLVHLPTEDKRKELLVVFTDDLVSKGLQKQDLEPGGDHHNEWKSISTAHIEKVKRSIDFQKPE